MSRTIQEPSSDFGPEGIHDTSTYSRNAPPPAWLHKPRGNATEQAPCVSFDRMPRKQTDARVCIHTVAAFAVKRCTPAGKQRAVHMMKRHSLLPEVSPLYHHGIKVWNHPSVTAQRTKHSQTVNAAIQVESIAHR